MDSKLGCRSSTQSFANGSLIYISRSLSSSNRIELRLPLHVQVKGKNCLTCHASPDRIHLISTLGDCRTYEKSTARQGKRPKISGFLVTSLPLCTSESSHFALVSPPARYDPPKSDRLLASQTSIRELDNRQLELRIRHGRHVNRAGTHVTGLSPDDIQDIIAYMRDWKSRQ